MSVIFLLIIISVSVASVFLIGFIWAVKNGQYEDDYSPSVRMLFDDEKITQSKTKSQPELKSNKTTEPKPQV